MPSTFMYSNSAPDIDALERQLLAADRAGYTVDLRHAFQECVPPSVSALERPQLRALVQRIGAGDVVVTMNLLRAIAVLDEATRSDRMRASAAEAKARGKQLGRRPTLAKAQQQSILQTLANGTSVSETARLFSTSRQTVLRIRTAHASQNHAFNNADPGGNGPDRA